MFPRCHPAEHVVHGGNAGAAAVPRGVYAAHGGAAPGKAVQVEPTKSIMNAPGNKRLKLQYGKLLSSFAFNFNLRRYIRVFDHSEQALRGGTRQTLLATSSNVFRNLADVSRHVIDTHWNPHFLSQMEYHDAPRINCLALLWGHVNVSDVVRCMRRRLGAAAGGTDRCIRGDGGGSVGRGGGSGSRDGGGGGGRVGGSGGGGADDGRGDGNGGESGGTCRSGGGAEKGNGVGVIHLGTDTPAIQDFLSREAGDIVVAFPGAGVDLNNGYRRTQDGSATSRRKVWQCRLNR